MDKYFWAVLKILVFLALLPFGLLISGVGLLIIMSWFAPEPTYTRTQIEQMGWLKLSENTEVLNTAHLTFSIDPAIALELSFPCTERQAFLADMGDFMNREDLADVESTENFSTTERFITNETLNLQWWKPDDIDNFESASYRKGHIFTGDVLAERGTTGFCKAYVYNGHM